MKRSVSDEMFDQLHFNNRIQKFLVQRNTFMTLGD